jgi:hypothetical protein
MVIVRGTGPAWNPQWWTPARCTDLERRNPVAYRSDVLAEFIDLETGLISPEAQKAATRVGPVEISPSERWEIVGAGLDTSEANGKNPTALVIVDGRRVVREGHLVVVFRVVFCEEWQTGGIENALHEAARHCHRYRVLDALADKYASGANIALARRDGLTITARHSTTLETVQDYADLNAFVASGMLELSPHPVMARDLLGIRKRATPTGFSIELPHTSDGRHADFCPALVNALKQARAGAAFSPNDAPQAIGGSWTDFDSFA